MHLKLLTSKTEKERESVCVLVLYVSCVCSRNALFMVCCCILVFLLLLLLFKNFNSMLSYAL